MLFKRSLLLIAIIFVLTFAFAPIAVHAQGDATAELSVAFKSTATERYLYPVFTVANVDTPTPVRLNTLTLDYTTKARGELRFKCTEVLLTRSNGDQVKLKCSGVRFLFTLQRDSDGFIVENPTTTIHLWNTYDTVQLAKGDSVTISGWVEDLYKTKLAKDGQAVRLGLIRPDGQIETMAEAK